MLIDLAGLAVAGGLYIVPAFAAVQLWSPQSERARVIAAVNVISAAFMTVASLGLALLQWQGFGLGSILTILGLANLAAITLILLAWGKQGVQDVGVFLFKTFLGLEVKGYENLPAAGNARHHRAEPREPARRGHHAFADAEPCRLRHRHRHGAEVVGEAVPETRQRACHRSDQAHGHAASDPGREAAARRW